MTRNLSPNPLFYGRIGKVRTILEKTDSILQSWLDHTSYKEYNKQKEIIQSYRPDLIKIAADIKIINQELEEKDWLRSFIYTYPSLRPVFQSMASVLRVVANILTLLGIPNGLSDLIEVLDQKLIE